MVGVVLGPGCVWSRLCHQSLRLVVVITVVPLSSPLVSPSVRNRRSARVSLESKLEVEDDKWDPGVSDSAFKINFLFFRFE